MTTTSRFRLVALPPVLGGQGSSANDVCRTSDGRYLATGAYIVGALSRAVRWVDGEPTDLSPVEDFPHGEGISIASDGQVAGNCWGLGGEDEVSVGAVWKESEPLPVAPLAEHNSSQIDCMTTSAGLLSGSSFRATRHTERTAVYWRTRALDLCATYQMPDDPDKWPSIRISARNNKGVAVGSVFNASGSSALAIWEGTQLRILDAQLPCSGGIDITDTGMLLIQQSGLDGSRSDFMLGVMQGSLITPVRLPTTDLRPCHLPVIEHSDRLRVVLNDAMDAGRPIPQLIEADNPGEIPDATPINLNDLVDLPPGWGQINHIFRIRAGGLMVGCGQYRGSERGVMLVPNQ